MPKGRLFVLVLILLQGGCSVLPSMSQPFDATCGTEFTDSTYRTVFRPMPYPSIRGFSPTKDEFVVDRAANRLSLKSLKNAYDGGLSRDFKDGYRQAYRAVARGGSGATPAIPPARYWRAHFRTPRGHEKAQQWFAGYRQGTEHAVADGIPDFNFIPTSTHPVYAGQPPVGDLHPIEFPQAGCSTCNQQLPTVAPSFNQVAPVLNGGNPAVAVGGQYLPNAMPIQSNAYR